MSDDIISKYALQVLWRYSRKLVGPDEDLQELWFTACRSEAQVKQQQSWAVILLQMDITEKQNMPVLKFDSNPE